MKSYIFSVFLIIWFSAFFECDASDDEATIPSCIKTKIEQLKNAEVQNPPAQVWEWNVDGASYYYITADCCDQYNLLYDSNCNIICAPDGGITGNGDGKCPTFNGTVQKTLIWEDFRK